MKNGASKVQLIASFLLGIFALTTVNIAQKQQKLSKIFCPNGQKFTKMSYILVGYYIP